MSQKTILLIFCLFLTSCSHGQVITPTLFPEAIQSTTPTKTVTPTQAPTPTPTSTPTPTPATTSREYVVKQGDSLWEISEAFAIPIAFIALKNALSDPDLLFPGQVLIIPEPDETPPEISRKEKLIVVILSMQKLYAYENGKSVKEFLVSTGRQNTPTVQGIFAIYLKYDSTRMTGPGYDLKNVPWTMYFFGSYGIHGTYWHSNFGHPMSHGCVNMKTDEAEWLYHWAPIGTTVQVLP